MGFQNTNMEAMVVDSILEIYLVHKMHILEVNYFLFEVDQIKLLNYYRILKTIQRCFVYIGVFFGIHWKEWLQQVLK